MSASASDAGMDDFSFDLAKLGEKPSGLTIGNGKRVVEEMGSEDDGPEDFTLNMEKWMRGKEIWRKKTGENLDEGSGDDENGPEPRNCTSEEPAHSQDDEEEEAKRQGSVDEDELEYEGGDESEFLPLSTSTPAPSRLKGEVNNEESQEEAETPKNHAPPLSRLNTEAKHDRAAEEVFDRISALQEEVESMRIEDENRYSASQAQEREHQKLQEEYDDLNIQLQKERKTAEDWQAKQARANEEVAVLMGAAQHDAVSKIESLQAKFEQQTKELASIQSEAKTSKRAADAKIAALERQLEISQDENNRNKNAAENVQAATSSLLKQLRSELETSRSETAFERKRLTVTKDEHTAALETVRTECQTSVSTAKADATMLRIELEHAQEQLTETRRIVTVVEDENDRLTQENDLQAADISELRMVLHRKDSEVQTATSKIEELNSEIERLRSEKEQIPLQIGNQESLDQLKAEHRQSLLETQEKHSQELATLRSTLLKAAEGMRKREARLSKTHHDEVDSLKQEIVILTQRLSTATIARNAADKDGDGKGKPEELRKAIRLLSQQLSTTKADLDTAQHTLNTTQQSLAATQESLTTAQQEAEDARQAAATALSKVATASEQLDCNASINTALEVRFAQVVEEREKEWRQRIALLFRELKKLGLEKDEWEKEKEEWRREKEEWRRERAMMGKALMHGWGREEVGVTKEIGQGQKYRYLYAKRPA